MGRQRARRIETDRLGKGGVKRLERVENYCRLLGLAKRSIKFSRPHVFLLILTPRDFV